MLMNGVRHSAFRLTLAAALLGQLLGGLTYAAEPKMRAHFIDVGQGAATLLEFPCGAVLIDTGAQDQEHVDRLIAYLRTFFGRRVDLHSTLAEVLITHPHIDHTMGLKAVAQTFKVLNYIDDGQTRGSGKANVLWMRKQIKDGSFTRLREVWDDEIQNLPAKRGLTDDSIDPLKCDDCDPKIVILSGGKDENPGWSKKDFQNLNNHSLVSRVDFGESSFLFTGDMESPALATLVDYYRRTSMLDVDVYQVGHHGSYNATTEGFLERATPQLAVISCGEWDFGKDTPSSHFTTFAYGHPRYVAINLLSEAITGHRPPIDAGVFLKAREPATMQIDKKIYCTGWDGTVTIEADLHGHFQTRVEKHKTPPPTQLTPPEAEPVDHEDAQTEPSSDASIVRSANAGAPGSVADTEYRKALFANAAVFKVAQADNSQHAPDGTVDALKAQGSEGRQSGKDRKSANPSDPLAQPAPNPAGSTTRQKQTDLAELRVTNAKPQGRDENGVQLGQTIEVTVEGLSNYLTDHPSEQLILFLDHLPFPGLQMRRLAVSGNDKDKLLFDLRRVKSNDLARQNEDSNQSSWDQLLGAPSPPLPNHRKNIYVTVGRPNQPCESTATVDLIVIPQSWGTVGLIVVILVTALLIILAVQSDLLRDSTPVIQGFRRSFSLSRVQLAAWFWAVVTSYVFIWVVNGETGSVTSQVLALLGISSATLAGSLIVDNRRAQSQPGATEQKKQLEERIEKAREAYSAANNKHAKDPKNEDLKKEATQKKSELKQVVDEYKSRFASEDFLTDVLSDENGVSIHRFQIFGWTFVLIVIFSQRVWQNLAMPQLDANLLLLMGISAGTYVGLKSNETKGS